MCSQTSSEIAYVKATSSQAIDQLNQFVQIKQAKQNGELCHPKASPLSWIALQFRWITGFLGILWHVFFLEKERLF